MKKSIICVLLSFLFIFTVQSSQKSSKEVNCKRLLNQYTTALHQKTLKHSFNSYHLFYFGLSTCEREKFFLEVLCPLYEDVRNFSYESIAEFLDDILKKDEKKVKKMMSSKEEINFQAFILLGGQRILKSSQSNFDTRREYRKRYLEERGAVSLFDEFDNAVGLDLNQQTKVVFSFSNYMISVARSLKSVIRDHDGELNDFDKWYNRSLSQDPSLRKVFFEKIMIPFYKEVSADLFLYLSFLNDKLKEKEDFLDNILKEVNVFQFEDFKSKLEPKYQSPTAKSLQKLEIYNRSKLSWENCETSSKRKSQGQDVFTEGDLDSQDVDESESSQEEVSTFQSKRRCEIEEDSLSTVIAKEIKKLFNAENFEKSYANVDKEAKFNEYVELLKKENLRRLQALVDEKKEKHKRVIFTIFEGVRLAFSRCTEEEALQDIFFNSFLTVLNNQPQELSRNVIFCSCPRVRNAEKPWNNCYQVFPESITSWTAVLKETEQLYLENIMS